MGEGCASAGRPQKAAAPQTFSSSPARPLSSPWVTSGHSGPPDAQEHLPSAGRHAHTTRNATKGMEGPQPLAGLVVKDTSSIGLYKVLSTVLRAKQAL